MVVVTIVVVGCIAWSVVRAMRVEGFKDGLLNRPLRGMAIIIVFPFVVSWSVELLWKAASLPTEYEDLLFLLVIALFVSLIAAVGLIVWPIATSVVMLRSYREATPMERRLMRWPVWGTGVSLGGILAIAVIGTMSTYQNSGSGLTHMVTFDILEKAFCLLIPISFAIGILGRRRKDPIQ